MKKVALFMILFMAFYPLASCLADFERSAEINSPGVGEEVYGQVEFSATLIDDDEDNVSWAVRKGTCLAGIGTVLGNVDGHSDAYTWVNGEFTATADTTSWDKGSYCFIFNPSEDSGETDIRLTREFEVVEEPVDNIAPEVAIIRPLDDEIVSGIVDIDGTVQDDNLKRYVLTIVKNSSGETVKTVTSESGDSFVDELILSWDTEAVDNGIYTITLTAEDESGNEASDEISIKVENVLHLENKNQCKNGGWRELGFKNQGTCVSFLQSNENAGKRL